MRDTSISCINTSESQQWADVNPSGVDGVHGHHWWDALHPFPWGSLLSILMWQSRGAKTRKIEKARSFVCFGAHPSAPSYSFIIVRQSLKYYLPTRLYAIFFLSFCPFTWYYYQYSKCSNSLGVGTTVANGCVSLPDTLPSTSNRKDTLIQSPQNVYQNRFCPIVCHFLW